MDYLSLPRYPSHVEADPSQADRHRDGDGCGLEERVFIGVLTAALFSTIVVLIYIALIAMAAGLGGLISYSLGIVAGNAGMP